MRVTLSGLRDSLQSIFGERADEIAAETGFVVRKRKITGASFLRTLVLGWLSKPDSTIEQLLDSSTESAEPVTAQALEQRFPKGVGFLKEALNHAVAQQFAGAAESIPLLNRFPGVYVEDCTTVALPDELADLFPGCGGSAAEDGRAAVKLFVRLEVRTGGLVDLDFTAGRGSDIAATKEAGSLPRGSLRLADRGFFSTAVLRRDDRTGVFYVSRLPCHVLVSRHGGPGRRLTDVLRDAKEDRIDETVGLTADGYSCRMVAIRCPEEIARRRLDRLLARAREKGKKVTPAQRIMCEWTVLVTNLPAGYTPEQLVVLYRVRWQIECLFKRWKHWGKWGSSRGRDKHRVMCEFYAKLTGLVLLNAMVLMSSGPLAKASMLRRENCVRAMIPLLRLMLDDGERLLIVLQKQQARLEKIRKRRRRKGAPNTRELLFGATLKT